MVHECHIRINSQDVSPVLPKDKMPLTPDFLMSSGGLYPGHSHGIEIGLHRWSVNRKCKKKKKKKCKKGREKARKARGRKPVQFCFQMRFSREILSQSGREKED